MKVALIFYGQIRTGLDNIHHLKGFLDTEADVFVHSWDDEPPETVKAFASAFDAKLVVENQNEVKQAHPDLFWGAGVPLHYSIAGAYDLLKRSEQAYDIVVVTRPDIRFHNDRRLSNDIEEFKRTPDSLRFGLFKRRPHTRRRLDNLLKGHLVEDHYWLARPEILERVLRYRFTLDAGLAFTSKIPFRFRMHCAQSGTMGTRTAAWDTFIGLASFLREAGIAFEPLPMRSEEDGNLLLRSGPSDRPFSITLADIEKGRLPKEPPE